jgi:ribosomal protein S18 acetylase RimI-like enzyme
METPVPPRLRALTEPDFEPLARLAGTIWRAHYSPLIGAAQVEYMLGQRYRPEALRPYLDATDRWLDLLELEDALVGYCSFALASAEQMKLEQLYLLPEVHGRGLGALMLRHVHARTRAHGRRSVVLTVARRNLSSIAFYRKAGYEVVKDVVIDIGGGFTMDDHLMEKKLAEE